MTMAARVVARAAARAAAKRGAAGGLGSSAVGGLVLRHFSSAEACVAFIDARGLRKKSAQAVGVDASAPPWMMRCSSRTCQLPNDKVHFDFDFERIIIQGGRGFVLERGFGSPRSPRPVWS